MKFEPQTEEQIAASSKDKEFPVFEPGDYAFEVITANEGPSKTSLYSRIAMNIKIFKPDGSYTWVNDYLSASPAAAFKIRNFAEAVGLLDKYKSGEFGVDDVLRKTGTAKVIIEPATTEYKEKNKIVSYIVSGVKQDKKQAAVNMMKPRPPIDDLEDSIPF